jgi:TRAP transporter TAXI family solute receptor
VRVALLVIGLSTLIGTTVSRVWAQEGLFTIATGTAGGIYHPLGASICRMFHLEERTDARRCRSRSSSGSVANLGILRQGRAEFALVQADLEEAAVNGTGVFAGAGPDPALRVVLSLHIEYFTVILRAGLPLGRFKDLRGHRIGIGEEGSGQYASKDDLFAAYGLSLNELAGIVQSDPATGVEQLCEGRLDALFFFVGHPNGLLQDAAVRCGVKFLPISGPEAEQLTHRKPFFSNVLIPGGIYRGIDQDTPTLGTRCVLLASASVPEDTVYELVKAVFDHFDTFRRLHPAWGDLTRRMLVPKGLAAPLHAGAERYLREHGYVE